jgi:hypothetical protein
MHVKSLVPRKASHLTSSSARAHSIPAPNQKPSSASKVLKVPNPFPRMPISAVRKKTLQAKTMAT